MDPRWTGMSSPMAMRSPSAGEDGGRVIAAFLDIGREGGAAEGRAHLDGDGVERVADDGDLGGIEWAARGHRRAPDFGVEDEIRKRVDGGGPAGGEIRGSAEFGDDGRAGDAIAGLETGAVVECRAAEATIFEDAVRRDLRVVGIGFGKCCASDAWFARARDGLHAESDDFDRTRGVGVAIGLSVKAMEARDGAGRPVDAEFESLALVAEVSGAGKNRAEALSCEGRSCFGLESAKDGCDLR